MQGPQQLFFLAAALSAAFVGFGGCGGTAVIDGQNDTGGGGSGAGSNSSSSSTTTTSTTTTTTTTSTNVGGGTPSAICEDACDAIAPCGGIVQNCEQRCTAGSSGCVTEQADFISCTLMTAADLCTWPPFNCQQQLFDYVSCRSANPVPGGNCSGNGNDCQCLIFDGQNHAYESFCSDTPSGGFCDCLADGDYVGTCWQDGPGECDPYSNCCGALIFIAAPP